MSFMLWFEVMSMIKHGLRGAEKISELVQAMKSYAYLDQGVQQEVNGEHPKCASLFLYGILT